MYLYSYWLCLAISTWVSTCITPWNKSSPYYEAVMDTLDILHYSFHRIKYGKVVDGTIMNDIVDGGGRGNVFIPGNKYQVSHNIM